MFISQRMPLENGEGTENGWAGSADHRLHEPDGTEDQRYWNQYHPKEYKRTHFDRAYDHSRK